MSMEAGKSSPSVFSMPGFSPFFIVQLLGAFNDNFLKNAVILLVTAKGMTMFGLSPGIVITIISGLFILPFFLISATSGQLADKYSKTQIIRVVKMMEVGIMLICSLGFYFANLPVLIAGVFLMGVHSSLFGPVKYSILPQLMPDKSLLQGNAWVETGTFLAILLGTIAGGFLVLAPNGELIVAGGTIVIAMIGLGISRFIPMLSPVDASLVVRADIIKPTIDIIKLTQKTRSVFLSILGISWFWFYGAILLQLFPVYVTDVIHGESLLVTVLLACFCVGIALGSVLVERISGKNLELALVPIGSAGMSIFALDMAFIRFPVTTEALSISQFFHSTSGLHLIFDLLMMAGFGGFFTVPLYTLIQHRVDKSEQSRVVGGNNIFNAIFMVAASVILGVLLAANVSLPNIVLILSLMNAAVAVYIFRLMPEFLLRFAAWIVCRVMYKRIVTGDDHIPSSGPVVLVCNHISYVDWIVLSGAVARPMRYVMDHRIAAMPVVSLFFKLGKAIPIAPEKENAALKEQAFLKIKAVLDEGEMVCIFPEGRLTADGEIGPFKSGIERILADTPVTVIPVAIHGLWGSMFSRESKSLKVIPRKFRSPIRVAIGAPLTPVGVSAAGLELEVRGLRDRIKD